MIGLKLQGVCASPWGSPLLTNINFELEPGKMLGVIGPNGAGKSSLLHCIAGGIAPSAGKILLGGSELATMKAAQRAHCVAMQVQHSVLSFPFSVEEVILMGRTPHASGQAADMVVLQEVMKATDTSALRDRPYTQLSGGEKQRVQLARAVAQVWRAEDSPQRLLLLDEPNSALDLSHQRMVMELVKQLTRQGCTVIVATHDFNLLSPHADQLLVLQRGKQFSHGLPGEVLTTSMFREVFQVNVSIQQHPGNGAPLVFHQ